MYGTQRTTGYGYSLWEFKVYGASGGTTTPPTTAPTTNPPTTPPTAGPTGPALPAGGSLGANVTVFDPS